MSAFGFALTPAQLELVERTHAFARDVVRPVAAEYDEREEFPWPVLEEAARQGFYNPLFYRDLITDPTGLSLPLFMEELFWGCAGIGLSIVMPALALSAFNQAATPEQLLRFVPHFFGEPGDLKLAALAVSEPQGGSDVKNLQTTARRDGGDWVINGHKMWIGNGGIANVHVVNATVDPELGHRGQAMFIVPGGTPGLECVRKLKKLGCRASHTAELRFEECRVPGDHLLGGDEKLEKRLSDARADSSRSAALGAFEQTRPMVAAQALGIARAALEFASEYAHGREAFGAPIIENQGVSFPLAELAAELD
jgi:acyl-CoA dehydrogenase